MHRTVRTMLALAITLAAIAAPAASARPGAQGKGHPNRFPSDHTETVSCEDADGNPVGTITYVGPQKLWPPNHKYADATVTATDEDPDDMVSLTTTGTHDQFDSEGAELVGSGNTDNDIEPAAQTEVSGTGSASQSFTVRSERSGTRLEGRTYTITADAMFSDSDGDGSSEEMSMCHAEFQIVVPHDMRPANRA